MEYFTFIKKIKIFSILSVFFPLLALTTCLFLYSSLHKIALYSNIIDYEKERLYIEWDNKKSFSELESLNSPSIGIGEKKTFSNCPRYLTEGANYAVLRDGTEILRNDKNFSTVLKELIKKNKVVGLLIKRTTKIDDRCIKNHPLFYKILINSPTIEKILIKAKLENKSGFASIKNPFLYGEVSISRTARYFPANFIFKPLIILAAIFLIIYWMNNFYVFSSKNLNIKRRSKNFILFGLLSCIFLILHSIFLGISFDNDIFKIFRKSIIVLFIIFEVTAQILLTKSLYLNQKVLDELINIFVLKIKIAFVIIVFTLTIISFVILIFYDPSTVFKHVLEWNYFSFLLIYYILSYFMWNTTKTQVHAPEGA